MCPDTSFYEIPQQRIIRRKIKNKIIKQKTHKAHEDLCGST